MRAAPAAMVIGQLFPQQKHESLGRALRRGFLGDANRKYLRRGDFLSQGTNPLHPKRCAASKKPSGAGFPRSTPSPVTNNTGVDNRTDFLKRAAPEPSARRHDSAASRQGKAGEAKRQHGPRGKLWNWGGGRASGDHDFRVGVGEVRVDAEESTRTLENTAFTKGRIETIIRGLAGYVHKQEIGTSKEYGIEILGMALKQASRDVSAIEKVGEIYVKSPCSLVNVYVTAAGAGAANTMPASRIMKRRRGFVSIGFLSSMRREANGTRLRMARNWPLFDPIHRRDGRCYVSNPGNETYGSGLIRNQRRS